MPPFDERSSKYRHCCCHIRMACYVIGILQLLSVLFILVQHSIRSIIADVERDKDDDRPADPITTTPKSDFGTRRWLGTGATTPLVTWAICETLFLGLTFYGVAKIRPWLLIPQLFLQAITVVVCTIVNILMVCVLAWHPNVRQVWYFLITTLIIAFLYEYFLIVLIRTYRYIRDKEMFQIQQSLHGTIFVLSNGNDAAIMESRMYSDLPPEYATALSMMTVDEANKNGTSIVRGSTIQQQEEEANTGCTGEQEKEEVVGAEEEKEEHEGERDNDDSAPPPTYEQARQMQNTRKSSSAEQESNENGI